MEKVDQNRFVLAIIPVLWLLFAGCDASNTAGQPGNPNATTSSGTPPSRDLASADLSVKSGVAETGATAPQATAPDTLGVDAAGQGDPPPASDSLQNTGSGSTQFAGGMPDPDTLYEAWPRPDFVLAVTGEQHGYIEPCGCTGLANQKGGMARRHALFKQISARNWPLLAVDTGNQVRRYGRQAEIKFEVTANALRTMGYEAVALGADDLRLSSLELVRFTHDETQPTPFLSANAAVFDSELTASYKIVERGGRKIGITAVIGQEWLDSIKNGDIVKTPPAEALRKVLPKFRDAGCDVTVLVAHATLDESRALGGQFPDFDIVVTAGGDGDPTFQPEQLDAGPMLVRVGEKAMHVGLIGFFGNEKPRYQRIPLTDKFKDEDAAEMRALLASYQDTLKQLGLSGLGLRPLPHPTGRLFVGSEQCQECHETEYEKWASTGHFDATESLVHPGERGDVARHHDPECLSCHVTGWDPQNFQPYLSGYLGLEESPLLHTNGCENCHGPGSEHVAAERGDEDVTEEVQAARQAAMQLSLIKAEQDCMKCHDLDNSPDFHVDDAFAEYWEKIEH